MRGSVFFVVSLLPLVVSSASCGGNAGSEEPFSDAGAAQTAAETRRALHDWSSFRASATGSLSSPATPAMRSFALPSVIEATEHDRFVMRSSNANAFFDRDGFALSLLAGGRGWGLHANLVGARAVTPVAEAPSDAVVHSYLGGPSRWRTAIRTFGRVAWEQIYPSVDMVAEPAPRGFAYRFVVSPGGRPESIALDWKGATAVRAVDDGRGVEIETDIGVLHVSGLRAFAMEHGKRRELRARHVVDGSRVSIAVDGWSGDVPLVIDPSVSWSGYLGGTDSGGSNGESASGIAVDGSGNVYVTGATYSTDFPTTGGFDTTYGGSSYLDAFVAKVSSTGSLVWSSYLGDSGDDSGQGITVDTSGNVYVAGIAGSSTFPTTAGLDTTIGGISDAFVTKISAGGTIVWSTFLGGSGQENCGSQSCITIDSSGNLLLTGSTTSSDFPTTGGFDTTANGSWDAFVVKMTSSGSVVWGSYLGGTGLDLASSIAVDGSGNVAVTGSTQSSAFPTTGGFDTSLAGTKDAYVAKVSATGALVWSSYLGGTDVEEGYGVAFDASGNVFVGGFTASADFPMISGFRSRYGSFGDGYLTKISSAGSILWSSYLGGGTVFGLVADGANGVFMTGNAMSSTFATPGAFDTTMSGTDAMVASVTGGGSLSWASFLGGSGAESGRAIARSSTGTILVEGTTKSTDFPGATAGFDSTLAGAQDVFIASISPSNDGTTCSVSGDCTSGFCVDSVCCATACTAPCQACSAAKKGSGANGVCGAIADGTDPDLECSAQSCSAGTVTKAQVCNGASACRSNGTIPCAPYLCAGNACASACASDTDCIASSHCASTTCVTDFTNGVACSRGAECTSGSCADGVCCDKACTAGCEACTAAKKGGGADGVCAPIAAGTDPKGACAAPSCAAGSLTTNKCDGTGVCAGTATSCSPYTCAASATSCRSSCSAPSDCVSTSYCSGTTCVAKKGNGASCGAGGECTSGSCVDGVCCNTSCTGSCEACNESGSPGTCVAVSGAPRSGRTACSSDGSLCGGVCDGTKRDGCTYAPSSVACGASCSAAVETKSNCNGSGACVAGAPHSCAPFACADATSCATMGDAGSDTGDSEIGADTGTIDSAPPDSGSPDTEPLDSGVDSTALDTGADTKPVVDSATDTSIVDAPPPVPATDPKEKPVAKGDAQACTTASECTSGFCVDGVCCDSACDGTCRSCNLPQSPGKCALQPLGYDARGECSKDATCRSTCGGDGTCVPAFAGARCQQPKCTSQSAGTGYAVCSGLDGVCLGDQAIPFDCSPYVCTPAIGACRESCRSTADCADGFLCDTVSARCIAAPPVEDDGGCACSTSRPFRASSAGFGALLLAFAAISRRRTRA